MIRNLFSRHPESTHHSESYYELPQFMAGSFVPDEDTLKAYLRDTARRLNGSSSATIPIERTMDFLHAISPEMPIFRGTDFGNPFAGGEDFTVYPSVAARFAHADYVQRHKYPIVQVSSVGELISFAERTFRAQRRKGFVPAYHNIVVVQDMASRGSLKVLTRGDRAIPLPCQVFRAK